LRRLFLSRFLRGTAAAAAAAVDVEVVVVVCGTAAGGDGDMLIGAELDDLVCHRDQRRTAWGIQGGRRRLQASCCLGDHLWGSHKTVSGAAACRVSWGRA
jgi:hypothetical protein